MEKVLFKIHKKDMKKILKRIIMLSLVVSLIISSKITTLANKNIESKYNLIKSVSTEKKISADGEIVEFSTNIVQINAVAKSIPNYISGAIIPQSDGFKIILTNIGIDTIDKISLTWVLYDDIKNKQIKKSGKTFYNVKPGSVSYVWKQKKSDTVQERFELTGNARDGRDTKKIKKVTAIRWNFVGGRYGSIKTAGGERHHMPSKSVSPLSEVNGPCIRMLIVDHRRTASYGNSNSAKKFREKEKKKIEEGKFLAAQKLGIDDVNSLFGKYKYSIAMSEMVEYTKSLGYKK